MKQETLVLFTCDACGYRARIPRAFDGTAIACPSCGQSQVAKNKDDGRPRTGDTQVITMPKPAPAPAAKPAAAAAPVADGKISFHCGQCGGKARIPAEYSGRVVRCPTCDAVQIAMPGASPTTGRIVKGVAVTAAKTATLDDNGKIIFTCTACSFSGRLSQNYAGKAISCPSCKAPQVVDSLPANAAKDAPAILSTPVETVTTAIRKSGGDLDLGLELDEPAAKPAIPAKAPAPVPAKPAAAAPAKPPAPVPTPAPVKLPTPAPKAPAVEVEAIDELALAPEPAPAPAAPAPVSKPKDPGTSGRVVRRGTKTPSSAENPAPPAAKVPTPVPAVTASAFTEAPTIVTAKPASKTPLIAAAAAAVLCAIVAVIFLLQAGAAGERASKAEADAATSRSQLEAETRKVKEAEAAIAAQAEKTRTAEAAATAATAAADKAKADREALAAKLASIDKTLAEARAAIEKAMTNDTLTKVFLDLAPAKSALTQASQAAKVDAPAALP